MSDLPLDERTGTAWIHLGEAPLQVDEAFAFLQDERAGGLDLFIGTTRRWTEGRETKRLFYEAYTPMAAREMHALAEEAAARWPVIKTCLLHRLGDVPGGEASVILGAATAHRADAFEACRWLIDTLKKQVPIWKKEIYADGQDEWVHGQTPEAKE